MAEQEKWKWQEPGTAWHGIGLYHITLTIPDRRPLLGRLEIPDNAPCRAVVRRTPLGNALVNTMLVIPRYHPEVQVLHFCLMPDHLHFILYVRHTMPTGIGSVVRGFWQGAKKLGRAASAVLASGSSAGIMGLTTCYKVYGSVSLAVPEDVSRQTVRFPIVHPSLRQSVWRRTQPVVGATFPAPQQS